jgi:hypothetical protein
MAKEFYLRRKPDSLIVEAKGTGPPLIQKGANWASSSKR